MFVHSYKYMLVPMPSGKKWLFTTSGYPLYFNEDRMSSSFVKTTYCEVPLLIELLSPFLSY